MAHIYSGSRLYPGLAQEYRLLLPGTYHYAPPHDTSDSSYCFRGLIIYAPHTTLQKYHHYKYDIIPVFISFPHPGVS